jgi:hypothetical protein
VCCKVDGVGDVELFCGCGGKEEEWLWREEGMVVEGRRNGCGWKGRGFKYSRSAAPITRRTITPVAH